MGWFGAGHINTPSSTHKLSQPQYSCMFDSGKGHKCCRKGHTCCRKLHNFWFHKWVHFLVPEMGTSFYVSKGRTQKWVPNMSPFLEPENSDFGCRASVKYMIRSKLTNHVHKDCFYQAHMSCNTAPCLEVLQGF